MRALSLYLSFLEVDHVYEVSKSHLRILTDGLTVNEEETKEISNEIGRRYLFYV